MALSPVAWRRWSGALLASGLGLTMASAWYHFQGLATATMTLVSLAIGIALFAGGILAARKVRPTGDALDVTRSGRR